MDGANFDLSKFSYVCLSAIFCLVEVGCVWVTARNIIII